MPSGPTVSAVLETDSVHSFDNITIGTCLEALARQDYPRERIEMIVVDGQGVFAPLRDPTYFARLRVNPDLGTICWPNDADWDPLVLYSLVTRRPIETLLAGPRSANAGPRGA